MKNNLPILRLALLPAALLTFGTGCTVVRENVVSTINTGFGVQVAQNPQTQVPEVKIGYIRSQFYSIPTAKTVGTIHNELSSKSNAPLNDPSKTPELVSGIRAGASAKSGIVGMDISENFAVGKIAVMSPAAIAMYISQAENAGSAQAASKAVVATQVADHQATMDDAAQREARLVKQIDGMDSIQLAKAGTAAKEAELFEEEDVTDFGKLNDEGKKAKLKQAVGADSEEDRLKVKLFEQLVK
jgi:hypothetical protein